MDIKLADDENVQDLPPGEYATRIVTADWVNGKLTVVLSILGPKTADLQSLFTLTKETDNGQAY